MVEYEVELKNIEVSYLRNIERNAINFVFERKITKEINRNTEGERLYRNVPKSGKTKGVNLEHIISFMKKLNKGPSGLRDFTYDKYSK